MKKNILFLFAIPLFFTQSYFSQEIIPSKLAHTYSIVARDPESGQMGVAVQTHWFNVGSRVPWAEAGVGAIATQSFTNPSFGPRGMELLKQGKTAQEVVDELIASDEGRDFRQLGIVDRNGNSASFTGAKCIYAAGNIAEDNFSVQANLMQSDKVWPAMAKAFKSAEGNLAEKMLAALEAAQNEGGDIRGKQSAAMIIVKKNGSGKVWEDEILNIKIADSPNPLMELSRQIKIHKAYEHMNAGDLAVEQNNIESAEREYGKAMELYPENLEIKYWYAVALANAGKIEESLPLFKYVFSKDPNWRELTERLPSSELLNVSEEELKIILLIK